MKKHIKLRLLWLILIGILLAACQEPTATDLTNQFFEQQQKYEEVQQIFQDAISTSPTSFPSSSELVKELGIRWTYSDGCNIYFVPFQSRKNGIGIKKGFADLCEPPAELVDDVDQTGGRQGFYVVYQHLADNWYLFREVYPAP